MRCIICDFSEGEAKSIYYASVVDPKGARNRRVHLDKKTGEPICTVCEQYERKSED